MTDSRSVLDGEQTELVGSSVHDRASGYDPGGYREVLRTAVPLILSTASLTVMLFVNRMFLSWYGTSAVAAATPGGITYFTICSFFMGTAQYVNSIVAQYHGAGDKPACARAVWQGIYFSLLALPVIMGSIPLGRALLANTGHDPTVAALEIEYFSILMAGGVFLPLNAALSSFFSGRGRTGIVLWGNLAGNVCHTCIDYCLIFGNLGFPEMGIRGAGLATVVTGAIPVTIWLCLFLSSRYQRSYRTRTEYRPDKKLLLMLLRYGIPSGAHFFLDISAFTVFVLLIGRLGEQDLAATNICLTIEMISFLPMMGMSIATATLVGQYIGRSQPHYAERSVYSALKLALGYTGLLALLYILVPGFFIELFHTRAGGGAGFETIVDRGVNVLRLIAAYTLFDTTAIVFSGGLKGAGDTRFAMWAGIIASWCFFVPPVYLMIEHLRFGVYAAWIWCIVYSMVLATAFWLRFRLGYWKKIRMIEHNGG